MRAQSSAVNGHFAPPPVRLAGLARPQPTVDQRCGSRDSNNVGRLEHVGCPRQKARFGSRLLARQAVHMYTAHSTKCTGRAQPPVRMHSAEPAVHVDTTERAGPRTAVRSAVRVGSALRGVAVGAGLRLAAAAAPRVAVAG
ncbi:hypothetical protein GCM10018962_49080 [Dactylosporangium matsuzakiense]|uniref:Uncharacterized protein n=1 Tax=Dactylosporangium matsuzakiense TaxID=53360 RepID=A0A9W6NSH4_9ACTN|nr:hypothetical protein GCM10017581_090980 [Dactylosporangium matsuzakiense]